MQANNENKSLFYWDRNNEPELEKGKAMAVLRNFDLKMFPACDMRKQKGCFRPPLFMVRCVLSQKMPTKLLDGQGNPLSQDVYSLVHCDLEEYRAALLEVEAAREKMIL